MKPVNLFRVSRIRDERLFNIMEKHEASDHDNHWIRIHEIDSLRILSDALAEHGTTVKDTDGFYFGFVIPLIGKEVDLVKVTGKYCLNIELKSQHVSDEQILAQLSAILGRQPGLPDWVYDGAILAVQEGSETVDRKIEAALDAGAKVCGVWCQDWCGCRRTGFGYQVMWNWEWDRDLYKEPEARIREWKENGVRFLGYINPFLAVEKGLYEYASAHGYDIDDRMGIVEYG